MLGNGISLTDVNDFAKLRKVDNENLYGGTCTPDGIDYHQEQTYVWSSFDNSGFRVLRTYDGMTRVDYKADGVYQPGNGFLGVQCGVGDDYGPCLPIQVCVGVYVVGGRSGVNFNYMGKKVLPVAAAAAAVHSHG